MSQNDSFLQGIYDKLTEISERSASVETTVDYIKEELDEVKADLKIIKQEDFEQNKLIAAHISGVRTVSERLNEEKRVRAEELAEIKKLKLPELEKRISDLEQPKIFFNGLKTIALYVAAISGAIITVLNLFTNIKK